MKHPNLCKKAEANRLLLRPTAALLAAIAVASCSSTSNETAGVGGSNAGIGGFGTTSGGGGASSTAGTNAKATGGAATGGSPQTRATGGRDTDAGGTTSAQSGGAVSTGGKAAAGGTKGLGGAATGGSRTSGGATTAGGSSATVGGSTAATGGNKAAGGATAIGGGLPVGGSQATGSSNPVGGTSATAGSPATGGAGGSADETFVENSGTNCNATSASLLSSKNPKLPNPFAMHDGTVISSKAQWECRRNEIKADLEKYEIGPKQEPPTVTATLSGTALKVVVTTSSGSLTLSSTVSGSGSCVAIGMNGAASLISGCTQIPFMHDNVIAYANGTGSQSQSDPFYKVYPSLWGKIGNYSAWSWGVSRLIDGIVQLKDQLKVDPTKIGVQGCSYAGKMALFAGAFDERVALTVAQESGGGGITSWRTSQDFTTRTGTNVEKIDNTNFAWFLSSMKSLDPYKLPHDHHELIAMVAPRAIIALGNPEYEWLGDESGYRSTMAAVEVFKAMGVADHIGYDFTGNHSHCSAATSQVNSVKTFVDRFLKGGTGATNIAIKPVSSKFDLDYTKVIDWTTPTLQ